jgi:hypothetical protein
VDQSVVSLRRERPFFPLLNLKIPFFAVLFSLYFFNMMPEVSEEVLKNHEQELSKWNISFGFGQVPPGKSCIDSLAWVASNQHCGPNPHKHWARTQSVMVKRHKLFPR